MGITELKFKQMLVENFSDCVSDLDNVQEAIELKDLKLFIVPILSEIENIYEMTEKELKKKDDRFKKYSEEKMHDLISALGEEYTKEVIRFYSWENYNFSFGFPDYFEKVEDVSGFVLVKSGDYYIDFNCNEVYTFSGEEFTFAYNLQEALDKKLLSYETMNEVSYFASKKFLIKNKRRMSKSLTSVRDLRKLSKQDFYKSVNSDVDYLIPSIDEENDSIIETLIDDINYDNDGTLEDFFVYLKKLSFEEIERILKKYEDEKNEKEF